MGDAEGEAKGEGIPDVVASGVGVISTCEVGVGVGTSFLPLPK